MMRLFQPVIKVFGFDLSPLPKPTGSPDTLQVVLNVALSILGAVAVLIIVLSALRISASNGDPNSISKSKNSIIYALCWTGYCSICRNHC